MDPQGFNGFQVMLVIIWEIPDRSGLVPWGIMDLPEGTQSVSMYWIEFTLLSHER